MQQQLGWLGRARVRVERDSLGQPGMAGRVSIGHYHLTWAPFMAGGRESSWLVRGPDGQQMANYVASGSSFSLAALVDSTEIEPRWQSILRNSSFNV